jgi:hypothetical protein
MMIIMMIVATGLIVSSGNDSTSAEAVGGSETRANSIQGQILDDIRPEQNAKITTLPNIVRQETVLAVSHWAVGDREYVCIITVVTNKGDSTKIRLLTFYEKKQNRLISRYSYATTDWFLSLYPLRDVNGNLLAIWGGGSAYHFVIFSVISGELKVTLRDGSYSMPEIVDFDNDGEYEILITNGKLLVDAKSKTIISRPESATLYRWNGRFYQPAWTGPWEARLRRGGEGRP